MRTFTKSFAVCTLCYWGSYLAVQLIVNAWLMMDGYQPSMASVPINLNTLLVFVTSLGAYRVTLGTACGLAGNAFTIAGGATAVLWSSYVLAKQSAWKSKFDLAVDAETLIAVVTVGFFCILTVFWLILERLKPKVSDGR